MKRNMILRTVALSAVLLLAGLVAPLPAAADATASYRENGRALFSFDVPDFWTLHVAGNRLLDDPDGGPPRRVSQVLGMEPTVDPTVWMGFVSPPGIATLAGGRAYLRDLAEFLALDPVTTPPVARRIGGLPAEVITGTGRRKGRGIQYSIAVIDLPGDRIAIGVAVIEAGTDPAAYDILNGIFASFRAGG